MMKVSVCLISSWILAVLLISCQRPSNSSSTTGDSLLITDARAQTQEMNRTNLNDQIHESRQNAITRAVKTVSPTVVGINVIEMREIRRRSPFSTDDPLWRHFFSELFRDRVYHQKVQSLGSGYLISSDGYILTNDHVAGEGTEIVITLPGGERHKAEIIGTDRISDITLLKIDGHDMPFINFGDSDDIMVGEWVIALGNPFGLFALDEPSVTVGVVSALHRDWGKDQESGRVYNDMIQTDAAINNGNSGGPLVNSLGEAIGMNTFIYTGSSYEHGFIGLGFAIPSNRIKKIVQVLKEGKSINREILWGFKVQDLSPLIIKALELSVKQGVIITTVVENSSASEADLQTEDVIIQIGDQKVFNVDGMIEYLEDMDLRVGDRLDFHIIRRGENIIIPVILKGKK